MSIETRVIQLCEEFSGIPAQAIDLEAKMSDIGLDSLDIIETVICIEDEFGVSIDEAAIPDGVTVQKFISIAKGAA